MTAFLISLLPIAQRWGGGPLPKAVVEGFGADPSTMLRMVPLPTVFAGREELT